MDRGRRLRRLEAACAGPADAQRLKPGVTRDWSVRDILAHVTTREEEALTIRPWRHETLA